MDDDPDVIRSQMDQTRTSLTEKLESLETRVAEGMQSTGAIVTDTVASVRGAVQSVGETLDLRLQVQRHPWAAFTASVALGYIAGRVTARQRVAAGSPSTRSAALPENVATAAAPREEGRARQGGLLTGLLRVVSDLGVQSLPLIVDALLRPHQNPESSQPLIAPLAAAPATLPLSSKSTTDGHRSRPHRFF